MKVLLIEDDPKASGFLKQGLTEQGFNVDTASDGTTGLIQAKTGVYDLIVLDVMLPGMTGWTLLSELRGQGVTTPVLYLTARDSLEDRVKGLNLGADGYLVKPFAFSEVVATIRSIIRRGGGKKSDILVIGDLELDTGRHRVSRGDQQILLTAKEFSLLSLLMRRMGEVLPRSVIAEVVWGITFDTDTNLVEVHIRRLRGKVDDPFPKKLIHTVRGVGYVLEVRD